MGIIVVDQGPELFWFVSNSLINEEVSIKQIQTIEAAERIILQELPSIVILNGDDKGSLSDPFISRMRNHVFTRQTIFIVFTSNTSNEFKTSLLMAGATQIFYRGKDFGPSRNFFASFIKWCFNFNNPKANTFEFKPIKFESEGRFTSYGRVGWVSPTHCLIETNISLNPNDIIECSNSLFTDLKLKDVKLKCIEKNKVGRYYQYSNSLLCEFITSNPQKDLIRIKSWVENNLDSSKEKSIKVIYFENSTDYRDTIRDMIKSDKRYCARGFNSLKEISSVLSQQMPQLILINRKLIQEDRPSFEKIKKYLKDHFCYCVTYNNEESDDLERYKKDFEFAMHAPSVIDLNLLEAMILKLEEKKPVLSEEPKVYLNKLSPYSRINLSADARITEMASSGIGVILPFELSSFSSCEIASIAFAQAQINRKQFFRSYSSKTQSDGIYHQLIYMGQTIKDNQFVRKAIEKISEVGFEKWMSDND